MYIKINSIRKVKMRETESANKKFLNLELKTINTFTHVRSRSFLENDTRFQIKIGKVFSDHQNGP